MKALSIILVSVSLISAGFESRPQLEDFLFSEKELPAACRIKEVKEAEKLPCNAKGNPFLSSEPEFLDCFAKQLIPDADLIPHIRRGLFSVYEDKSEIGIFGLEADSKVHGKHLFEVLAEKNPDESRIEFIQSGRILIMLWHDSEETAAFQEFR